jgi:bacterioferritin-associated ferredoxin
MIICHCHRVTDREIRSAVREGARNLRMIGSACGAGAGCGGCQEAVQDILDAERSASQAPRSIPAFALEASAQAR